MRSKSTDRQDVWFVELSEDNDTIDNVLTYKKPIHKKMTVSATSDLTIENSNGIYPEYDRYITSYDRRFSPQEGQRVFVDVIPLIDSNGYLSIDNDGNVITEPDYRIERVLGGQKSIVRRYGISKIGVSNE